MTEVHQYWTNQKEPVPVVVVAAMAEAVEVAVEEVEAAEILEGVDPPDWEDCSRLECQS